MRALCRATLEEAWRAHGGRAWACIFVVVYFVAFKRPRGRRLRWWAAWEAEDAAAASREVRDCCPPGFSEYGISRQVMLLNPGPPRWLSHPLAVPADVTQLLRE